MFFKIADFKVFRFIILSLLFSISSWHLHAQELIIDSLGYESFQMIENDTSYTMKKYFLVLLKEGDNRSQSDSLAAEIQKGHMAHMNKLAEQGFLDIAGPMSDQGQLKGMMILSAPTMNQVQNLVAQDPAVIAGRLIMEVKPFWAAKGSKLK